ncbi:MAG TPA: RNA-guided endonuclease TnpB family protein [Trebonia sp.]
MGRYAVPSGRIVKGWSVRLEPSPEQAARFRRDDGARRFARNWAVEQIHAAMHADPETGGYDSAVWSPYELRKRWNQVKHQVAPWWTECSKEAYSNGIADAVTALKNWHSSKRGDREGLRMRFPRFRKKGKDSVRCTYTTGALRVDDSRHVVLPGVGRVRTAENLRLIYRHIRHGTGRLLSATVREKNGRWRVSLRLEIIPPRPPEARRDAVGVDAGIGQDLLVIMRSDGTVVRRVANPKALRKVARVYTRVTAIRADTIHKATSELAKTHGQIVIEDLCLRGFARGMRKHRKAWAEAAFGEFCRQLTYKCGWYGSELWIADRFYPSSKTCSACGQINAELTLSDRRWTCQVCGTRHDRDENAGINLARLPASQAEAQSGSKTAPVRRATVKRVKHPRRMAASAP